MTESIVKLPDSPVGALYQFVHEQQRRTGTRLKEVGLHPVLFAHVVDPIWWAPSLCGEYGPAVVTESRYSEVSIYRGVRLRCDPAGLLSLELQ